MSLLTFSWILLAALFAALVKFEEGGNNVCSVKQNITASLFCAVFVLFELLQPVSPASLHLFFIGFWGLVALAMLRVAYINYRHSKIKKVEIITN